MYDIDGRIADLREQLRTLERSREILHRLDHDLPRARPPSVSAAEIRDYVWREIIRPAKKRGQTKVSIRCGDVHRDMRLRDRLPSVVSALETRRFAEQHALRLVEASGPKAGSNRVLTFEISPATGLLAARDGEQRPQPEAKEVGLATVS